MKGLVKLAAIGVLVLILLGAGIGSTIVLAQGPTVTPTPPAAGTTPTPPATGATPTPAAPRTLSDLYWRILAQKFGMTVERLQQTLTEARREAITEAVRQGIITQAQADRLLQQLQNTRPGTVFDNFRGRGKAANPLNDVRVAVNTAAVDAAARTLGMTGGDLTTALRGGKTLLDLAREKNVDVARLRTAIADAQKAALDQAVRDGKLTQAQADALKARITPENVDLNRRSLDWPLGGQLKPGLQRFGGRPGRR